MKFRVQLGNEEIAVKLSKQEERVLDLMYNGATIVETAEKMDLSRRTVEVHVLKLKSKTYSKTTYSLFGKYGYNIAKNEEP